MNQLIDEKKEHEIHYQQHSHLERAPIVSYHKNQNALFMLFKLMFRVSQTKMFSLNIGVTAPFFSGMQLLRIDFFNPVPLRKPWDTKEVSYVIRKESRDVRLNIQSEVAISISSGYKCVPVGVRICQISNYASDGGSRHREGDKYNLHVFLTSGKTERLSWVLPRKLLTSEDMMQSNHLHLRKTIKIQSRLKQVWEKRIEGTGNKEKVVIKWLLDASSLNLKINKSFLVKS